METSTQVPPPAPPQTDSRHHTAANYAVGAIGLSFLLNIAVAPSLRGSPPALSFGFSLFTGAVLVSAIPAGIIGLCGIKKFGRKRLLWKSLVGVLLPVLLTVMALPAYHSVRKASLQKQINQVVSEMSKRLPHAIDESTRLDRVEKTGAVEITAYFTITPYRADEIDRKIWETQIVPQLKTGINDSIFGALLLKGVHIKYVYSGSDGQRFDELIFSPADPKP